MLDLQITFYPKPYNYNIELSNMTCEYDPAVAVGEENLVVSSVQRGHAMSSFTNLISSA